MEVEATLSPPLNSVDQRRGSTSSPLPGTHETNDLPSRDHLSPLVHNVRSSSPSPGVYHSHPRRQSVAISMGLDLHGARWEREKQELKTKITELEEFKEKYENEKRENEILKKRLQELMAGQSDATKNLMKTNEALDRLQIDNKKKIEHIEKMQSDIRYKDDRIRNLEIRASEVEKAELILETTKQNLESTIQQVRVRDSEIKRLNKDIDDCNRQLETANSRIKELEDKMEDMKIQVRYEIMKNENIEKNLETIPRLKDTIKEKEEEIQDHKRQIEEKNALLTAARKGVREYKDKLRHTEQEISRTEGLKEELQLSQCEVQSLKQLMYGKDYLVTQKTKALDLSKEIIGVLNDNLDNDHIQRIQHLIDRLSDGRPRTISARSSGSTLSSSKEMDFRSSSAPPPRPQSCYPIPTHRELDVNNHPYGMESDHNGNQQNGSHGNRSHSCSNKRFLNQTIEMPDKRKRPVSAMPQPVKRNASQVHRTTSYKEAHKVYTKPLPRKTQSFEVELIQTPRSSTTYKSEKQGNTKLKPSLDYSIGTEKDSERDCISPRDKSCHEKGPLPSDADSVFSSESDFEEEMTSEQEYELKGFSSREKDQALADIINVGDRVLISVPQKPPRYSKRKAPKPINYTGIVKFKGKLNPEKYDARIHVGVRMDEPVGDTDGTYKGKRLMYTPSDQGKFFKLRELTSVLNVKTGRYIPVQRLIIHSLHKRSRSESQADP
ncbi:uncharacterized protein LOC132726265 isoform X2 [Ruditapes philippinarum]|uniref:uncharacterized protein LOC132726265 isoform X2 n=1 Tax=Ruditapes philippinarum TaxID=129788 RepID=UPI00295BB01E|nr:uncharacterized protein LOC132726265 isoform X2 [Ruditapes philippinarum]